MNGAIPISVGGAGGGAMGGFPMNMFQIHGNPGDYAWGSGGLDAVISQLLNQLDSSGAPPAPRETIDRLPKVTITKEQVRKRIDAERGSFGFRLFRSQNSDYITHSVHNLWLCVLPCCSDFRLIYFYFLQVEIKLQCSVCMEDYKVDETVHKLPCDHLFHENCIVPWLELHDTCPGNCRIHSFIRS